MPNNKKLDLFKLKAFADHKINMTQKLKVALGRIKNIEGKGEDTAYQHFLLFPQCLQYSTFFVLLKVGIFMYRVKCD